MHGGNHGEIVNDNTCLQVKAAVWPISFPSLSSYGYNGCTCSLSLRSGFLHISLPGKEVR